MFGWLHILSVTLSFVSVLTATLTFNEVEGTGLSQDQPAFSAAKLTGRLCIGLPFFGATLVFRAVGLALLICFVRFWSGIVVFL